MEEEGEDQGSDLASEMLEEVMEACIDEGQDTMMDMCGNEGQMSLIDACLDGYADYANEIADQVTYDYDEYMHSLDIPHPEAVEIITEEGFRILRPVYRAAIANLMAQLQQANDSSKGPAGNSRGAERFE